MASGGEEDMTSLLGDFCMPTLEDVDSHSLLSQSQYAMVVFHDVAETYPLDSDVLCRFTLTSSIQRLDDDTVAVMRVGWSKPDESIVSHPVPKPLNPEQKEFELVFKAGELPRDSEFYQLCYLSKGEVRGASVPFQFRHAADEELMVLECGDMAVIRSQPAVAEDMKLQIANLRHKLAKAQGELITAQEEARVADERTTKLTREHSKVKNNLESELKLAKELTQAQLKSLLEEKAALEAELKDVQEKMKKLQDDSTKEREVSALKIRTAEERIKFLEEENIKLSRRLEEVSQLERVMAQARAQSQAVEEDRDKAYGALQMAQVRIASLNDLVHGLQKEKDRVDRALQAKASAQDLVVCAQQEVLRQKEMLDAVQDAKELATKEMIIAVRGKEKAQLELVSAMEEIHRLKTSLKEERDVRQRQVEALEEQWRREKEHLLAELTRLASIHSKSDGKAKPALEKVLSQLNESQQLVQSLQTQVANLTEKLTYIEEKHRVLQEQHKEFVLKDQQLQKQREQEQQQQQQEQQLQQPEPEPRFKVEPTMSFSVERAKAAAGVKTLTSRLRVIQERDQQVRSEEEAVKEELLNMKQFVEELQEAALKLESEADNLKKRYDEADILCEATQAALFERDMSIAMENLTEKRACLESAVLRQGDLKLRQEELKEERAVLAQQAAQATTSLCSLASMLALEEIESSDKASAEAEEEPQVEPSPEVADLRARLRTAAEAYQQLYREKLSLERRLAQLKALLQSVQKQKEKIPVVAEGSGSSGERMASASSSTSGERLRELVCPFCPAVFPMCAQDLYLNHSDNHLR